MGMEASIYFTFRGTDAFKKLQGLILIADYDLHGNNISGFLVYHFVALYEAEYLGLSLNPTLKHYFLKIRLK